MAVEITRREFLLINAAVATSVAVALGYLGVSGEKLFESSIVDATGIDTQLPEDLALSFERAPTPSLNLMYSMFFPLLLDSGGVRYLNKIAVAA